MSPRHRELTTVFQRRKPDTRRRDSQTDPQFPLVLCIFFDGEDVGLLHSRTCENPDFQRWNGRSIWHCFAAISVWHPPSIVAQASRLAWRIAPGKITERDAAVPIGKMPM